jgi:hypothetical protein
MGSLAATSAIRRDDVIEPLLTPVVQVARPGDTDPRDLHETEAVTPA